MLPIKKILCPTDFSHFSDDVLTQASELALHFGAELCLLHVTQSVETAYCLDAYGGSGLWDVTPYAQEVQTEANLKLNQLLEGGHFGGCAVRSLLCEGNAADEIIAAAKDFDLIVIATHGRSGWRHLVFGSVAEKVIHAAPCPVWVLHARIPAEIRLSATMIQQVMTPTESAQSPV
jgi:nucleotide-binding universal stress UspA family protein